MFFQPQLDVAQNRTGRGKVPNRIRSGTVPSIRIGPVGPVASWSLRIGGGKVLRSGTRQNKRVLAPGIRLRPIQQGTPSSSVPCGGCGADPFPPCWTSQDPDPRLAQGLKLNEGITGSSSDNLGRFDNM